MVFFLSKYLGDIFLKRILENVFLKKRKGGKVIVGTNEDPWPKKPHHCVCGIMTSISECLRI